MIINISDIIESVNKERTEEVFVEMKTFSSRLGNFPILSSKPIALHIANRENKELLISGTVDMQVAIPCGRCLEDVPTDLHFDIDKVLTMKDGTIVDEEMEETDYLIGFEMDVDRFVYAEILVNWPMKVLCKDDCKGICKVCGMNLNSGACNCQRTELDPRMAAFQDIFKQFKEV
ncbi:MAG: DUF177 domain-containing protein [Agathobacter sp.]|nr:DUF177 domain-containing protein [Agathobacter sp.]